MGCLMILTEMELLLFLSLFVLMWSGKTFADESGSTLIRITEDEDVILPCSLTQTDITNEIFDWKKTDKVNKEVFFYQRGNHYNNGFGSPDDQFRGRVFHFQDQLQFGNASIIIRSTKVGDNGTYTCDFPFHQPKTRSQILLIVGAVSKPSVRTLDQTKERALLQCEVLGASPKPKVFWQDSTGNIIKAEEPRVKEKMGSYDIILQTTVMKTDTYRCVATQEENNHQVYEETYINISEFPTGLVVGVLVSVLVSVCVFVVGGFAAWRFNKSRKSRDGRYTAAGAQTDSEH